MARPYSARPSSAPPPGARHPVRTGAFHMGMGLGCILLERHVGAYLDDDMAAMLLILACTGLGIGITHPMIAR